MKRVMSKSLAVILVMAVVFVLSGATCLNQVQMREPIVTTDAEGNTYMEGIAVSLEEYGKYIADGTVPLRVAQKMLKPVADTATGILGLPAFVGEGVALILAAAGVYTELRKRKERGERIKLGMVIEEAKPLAADIINKALDRYGVVDSKFYENVILPKTAVTNGTPRNEAGTVR